ncbi:hypothetical protein PGH07_00540 [Sulfurovum sp. zt1-1]|uniref:Uncharacterized protein n=1 Tax=Sulfurovum zhangzhouensis TaxID=3019067 RepID=A0ABT7QUZ0_9BACT|nr:hypothetical protein [Sulfurovum zhangzhouensis]MDM5270660.1 hypothetical protein [Sulfurovum zhangzhouensis]
MYRNKKEKLFIKELLETPLITYPAYYNVSSSMMNNDYLHSALIALHSMDFYHYAMPESYEKIFETFATGAFAIFKEQYIVGYFGDKMMYLEANGWRAMPVTRDIFYVEHWLV